MQNTYIIQRKQHESRRESIDPFATFATPAHEGGGCGIGRTISSSSGRSGSESSFALDSTLDVSGGGFPETLDAMKSLLKKIVVWAGSESGRNRNRNRNQRRDEEGSGRAYAARAGNTECSHLGYNRAAPTHAFADCRHKDKAAPASATADPAVKAAAAATVVHRKGLRKGINGFDFSTRSSLLSHQLLQFKM